MCSSAIDDSISEIGEYFMLRKFSVLTVLIVLVIAATTVLAGATASFGGGFSGSIHWLIGIEGNFGSWSLDVYPSGNAGLTALCANKGGNVAPGVNPVTLPSYTVTGGDNGDGWKGYNEFEVVVQTPKVGDANWPTWEEAGCKNHNWWVISIAGDVVGDLSLGGYNGEATTFEATCHWASDMPDNTPLTCSTVETTGR